LLPFLNGGFPLFRLARFVALFCALALLSAIPANAQSLPVRPREVHAESCGAASAGHARCHSEFRLRGEGTSKNAALPLASTLPSTAGYTPSDLQGAYQLAVAVPAARLHGGLSVTTPTVAVVDAYDNPNAEADLLAYRTQ
jgi:hypothetical protein